MTWLLVYQGDALKVPIAFSSQLKSFASTFPDTLWWTTKRRNQKLLNKQNVYLKFVWNESYKNSKKSVR